MQDRWRFFKRAGPFTLEELASIGEAELLRGDPAEPYEDIASLQQAEAKHLAVFHNLKYKAYLETTRAGACLIPVNWQDVVPLATAVLVSKNPHRSFAKIAQAFYPQDLPEGERCHPSAFVHETAVLGEGCVIGPGAIVEAGAVLGPRCYVGPNCLIGKNVVMGAACVLQSHVTLTHAILGDGVLIKPGARIGQQGFGFSMEDPEAMQASVSVPQLGIVRIGNGVEIGANTTIDRGSLQDTVLEDGVRIDNLVQLGHNVHLGKGCVIVAQVGIAGSTQVGAYSILGGQVGVAGHLSLAPKTLVAAKSGVMGDTTSGETLAGFPAVPIQDWRRQSVALRKLGKKGSGSCKK